jgi:hypothetical protein
MCGAGGVDGAELMETRRAHTAHVYDRTRFLLE